jgi:hypothetical protein
MNFHIINEFFKYIFVYFSSLFCYFILLQTLSGLEDILMNCSEYLPENKKTENPPPVLETYYDKEMVGI